MEGFFDKKKFETSAGKKFSCISCGLYKHCQTPKIVPMGDGKKRIMNIGEFPSRMDDENGSVYSGKFGKVLKAEYARHGIDLHKDCVNINALRCHPHTELTASKKTLAINSCRKYVLEAIEKYKPHVIVLFGDYALQSLIGHRWKKDLGTIRKWRGWTIPDQDFKAWICPTISPTFVSESELEVEVVFSQDIKRIAGIVREPVPIYKEPEIDYIDDLSVLNEIKHGAISFDYETTGIKPHAKGHCIVCASVAVTKDKVYTFMIPSKKEKKQPFIDLLKNGAVYKIGHNIKFEDNWTNVRLRTAISGWKWDSQLAAHILDNRQEITSLKFQTYVRLGIVDYDSEINPILQSIDNTSNGFNKLLEYVKDPDNAKKVLKYCAYDSINCYRITEQQLNELNTDFFPF